jgi:hypothetical protein
VSSYFGRTLVTVGFLVAATAVLAERAPVSQTGVDGRLVGSVTTRDGSPIESASVRLESTTRATPPLLATTDRSGGFTFESVAPGRYTVNADKAGFLEGWFGPSPGGLGPPTPVAIEPDSNVRIEIELTKGATMAGRVLLPEGGLYRLLRLRLVRRADTGESTAVGPARTVDDDGRYRVTDLPPGEYRIFVSAAGVPSLFEPTDSELVRRIFGASPRDRLESEPSPYPALRPVALQPAYFPEGPAQEDGSWLDVSDGQQLVGVDLRVRLAPPATLRGTMLGPDGARPHEVQASLVDLETPSPRGRAIAPIAADGSFLVTDLPAGRYLLVAMGVQGAASDDVATSRLWAEERIDLAAGVDAELAVHLTRGAIVEGRISSVADGEAPDLTSVRVRLLSASRSGIPRLALPEAMPTANGEFRIGGVPPGAYRITVTGLADDWHVASGLINGVDSLDLPVEIRAGQDTASARVLISNDATLLSGRLVDADDQPVADLSVVAFPVAEEYWPTAERRIQLTRPDTEGRFEFRALPPGDYFLCAVAGASDAELDDPAYLRLLAQQALRFTLGTNEKLTQTFRIAGGT